MKIWSYVLSFCFMLNSFSAMAGTQELKAVIDDYQYALTVEWDQKDKKFFEEQTSLFLKKVELMIVEGQINHSEIIDVINQESANASLKRDLLEKIKLLNNSSPEELARFLSDNTTSLYQSGSSWAPASTVFGVGVGIVVVLGLIGLALAEARTDCTFTHRDNSFDEHYTCTLSEDQIFNQEHLYEDFKLVSSILHVH